MQGKEKCQKRHTEPTSVTPTPATVPFVARRAAPVAAPMTAATLVTVSKRKQPELLAELADVEEAVPEVEATTLVPPAFSPPGMAVTMMPLAKRATIALPAQNVQTMGTRPRHAGMLTQTHTHTRALTSFDQAFRPLRNPSRPRRRRRTTPLLTLPWKQSRS